MKQTNKTPTDRKPIKTLYDAQLNSYTEIAVAVVSRCDHKTLRGALLLCLSASGFVALSWRNAPWYDHVLFALLVALVTLNFTFPDANNKRKRTSPP